MSEEQPKTRILAWGDYCASTGFGTVMSNIMRQLDATGRYEIDVIGINHDGQPYDQALWPGKVWPAVSALQMQGAYADLYGRQKLVDFVGSGRYDVVFMLQDTFIVQEMIEAMKDTIKHLPKKPKLVYYYPLDANPKPEWIEQVVSQVDYPVTYTHWAKAEAVKHDPTLANRLKVIYHGTNLTDFNYLEDRAEVEDFRHKWFAGNADGRFLITNVNRNQPRKDTVRNLMVLKELKRRGCNPLMYLHMQMSDHGGNILVMAQQMGLELEKDFMLPHPRTFQANHGLPVDIVNLIYNASDMVFTPTLGEGWGLSLTEAMATKTPIVGPRNTSVQEILADNRGYLVDTGDNPSAWFVQANDLERIRPLLNVEKAADAIERIMNGEKPDIDAAYAWVQQYTWEAICKEWIALIDEAAEASRQASQPNRATRRKAKKLKKVA